MTTSSHKQTRLGIIGAGNMGGRIGQRIIEQGIAITAYDVDPSRAKAIGGHVATDVVELLRRCDLVFLSLPDSKAVEGVIEHPDGIAAHGRAGQVVVDLSTSHPSSTTRLNALLAEKGMVFLDAGISGGAMAAENGTLTIMVGGDSEALATNRWAFELFATSIVHMGSSGAGHMTKVLNNFLNGISLGATAEVMVAARIAGLDLEKFLEVINQSSGVNFATLNRFPRIIHGDYLEGGLTGELMAKDLKLFVDVVRELRGVSILGPSCLTVFEISNALGYGGSISNRVVDALGDMAGGVRLTDSSRGGT